VAGSADVRRTAVSGYTEISRIARFFIVKNVLAALSFYRDRLGFDITFQGPDPDDIFFGIVQRGRAMIMFKDVGVDPLPNLKREPGGAGTRTSMSPTPDALAAEFSSRNVAFSEPLKDTDDVCMDSNSRTLTATFCFSAVLVHERDFKLGFGVAESVA
jgi:hypothetical protein